MVFDGLPKTCPIAIPSLAQLVTHRVFAFWVGNCQKLELAPFDTCCPQPAGNRLPSQLPTVHHFGCVLVSSFASFCSLISFLILLFLFCQFRSALLFVNRCACKYYYEITVCALQSPFIQSRSAPYFKYSVPFSI